MHIITLHQPHAERVRLLQKWVENRTWPTNCRGRMGIHAGKKKMLKATEFVQPSRAYE